jgi:ornithine cyclodeaminase
MTGITILSEQDLRATVSLDGDSIACIESAFATLAGGHVVMPPILSMAIHEHNGEVDVKTAYVPGTDSFAIKVSPGFFDNPKIGLPTTSGLMILFSSKTGQLQAVLLDNGYLTDVRTAAAGGVAAKHLSRPDSSVAAIIGAGMQARLQLKALTLVRPLTAARIWARNPEKAQKAADDCAADLGITVTPAATVSDAVKGADIVVTTTPAHDPLLLAEHLEPGQHITAMGSDQETKCELEPACLARASLYVPDRRSQTEILGELRAAIETGAVSADTHFPELGDIVSGKHPGRQSDQDITIVDLTGIGLQDTAIATMAFERCSRQGAGTVFGK